MITSLVLLSGILLAAGLVFLVAAAVPAVPRLDAALDRVGLDGPPAARCRCGTVANNRLDLVQVRLHHSGAVQQHWIHACQGGRQFDKGL